MNDRKRDNTVRGLRILALIMLIVCVISVSLCYLVSSLPDVSVLGESQSAQSTGPAPSADPEPTATPVPEPVSTAAPVASADDNVSIPGWKEITIKADSTLVSVPFYSSEKNTNYMLSFKLKIPDGNGGYETVYESQPISAGEKIETAELSKALPAGRYENCILHVQPYSVSDMQEVNNVDETIVIISE